MSYYIIETNYVGPNADSHVDANTIEIHASPALGNLSREPVLTGWCGTTNDYAVYAHGEHATIELAEAAIAELFGDVREADSYHDVVATYKPGKYIPMSAAETVEWAEAGLHDDIDATTSDDRLIALAAIYERAANMDGYTLDRNSLINTLRDAREEAANA